MTEQLSLFEEENVAHNKCLERLVAMDFGGALQAFQRYKNLFPSGREVSAWVKQASFLSAKLGESSWSDIDIAEAERRYRIWMEFEEKFGWPWEEGAFQERLQAGYFAKVADGLLSTEHPQGPALPGGTPLGLIYLLAHRPDEAIPSLQMLIAEGPNNAAAYGYLGDAYHFLGDVRTARICYREAFAIDPYGVDLRRLRDRDLRARIEELGEGREAESLAWFPVRGQLEGFFESRVFGDLDTFRHWLDRYQELFEIYTEQEDESLIPKLFYVAMVLSDNARMLRHTEKVELVVIRRRMKEWQPALFARHMRLLELRRHP